MRRAAVRGVTRAMGVLNAGVAWACYGLLASMLAVTAMQVFLRFVVGSPTSWSEEVALVMLVWFGLLSIGLLAADDQHMAIVALRDLLPKTPGVLLDLFVGALGLVFAGFLLWASPALIAVAGDQTLPASGLPRAVLYWSVPVGGTVLGLNIIGWMIGVAQRTFGEDGPKPAPRDV